MRGPFGIAYSPLNTMVESEETRQPLWLKEMRDLARGFCGALVVALPLLYTQEMWERVRFLPTWMLLLALLLTYFANMGYILFEGYKPEPERHRVWLDALTTLGIGAVSSIITLALIGRYDLSMPLNVSAKLILLETIPTSFGASLAINQLGVRTRQKKRPKQPADDFSPDRRKITATLLGALLFSFNIAPTYRDLAYYYIAWMGAFSGDCIFFSFCFLSHGLLRGLCREGSEAGLSWSCLGGDVCGLPGFATRERPAALDLWICQ